MVQRIIQSGLIAGMLVVGLTPRAHAFKTDPGGQSIVFTVAAINAKTATATLQANDGGAVLQTTATASWKVGDKVLCDLVDAMKGPQLQNCQPWS